MNKNILEKIKGCKKVKNVIELFQRPDQVPIGSPWTVQTSSNGGAGFGFCLRSGLMYAYSQSGVACNSAAQFPIPYKDGKAYKVRFLAWYNNAGGQPGQVYTVLFGTLGINLLNGLNIDNNGVNIYSNAWVANHVTPTWFDIEIYPTKYLKFKYWKEGTVEPTDYIFIRGNYPVTAHHINFTFIQNTAASYHIVKALYLQY